LKAQTNDIPGAIQSYQSAFAMGLRDDLSFSDYVRLLAKSGDTDHALGAAETYVKDEDSFEVRIAEASVYRRLKKFQPAIEILREQERLHPEERQIGVEIASLYIATENYEQALEECNRLFKNGCSTALVHYFKGLSEFRLKRYDDAKATLHGALRQSPESNDIAALLQEISTKQSQVK
jgi:tetratricopeptide (TPR) repeat protein